MIHLTHKHTHCCILYATLSGCKTFLFPALKMKLDNQTVPMGNAK